MQVKIDKSFQKDTRKIKDKLLLNKIAAVISEVQKAENINQIKNLKKLKGSAENYRIKLGAYRLGIIISGSSFEFIRCLHRKDIYKYFPK
jgi:mRNA interferase RelE/StbE